MRTGFGKPYLCVFSISVMSFFSCSGKPYFSLSLFVYVYLFIDRSNISCFSVIQFKSKRQIPQNQNKKNSKTRSKFNMKTLADTKIRQLGLTISTKKIRECIPTGVHLLPRRTLMVNQEKSIEISL